MIKKQQKQEKYDLKSKIYNLFNNRLYYCIILQMLNYN